MTTQKNGTTIPTNGNQVDTTMKVVSKSLDIAKPVTENSPLDERLFRLNQLFELQTKYNRLIKSQGKLNEFKMLKGEENISFTIRDCNNREEFETKNPELINSVLECVRLTLIEKKKALEPLLKW